VWGNRGVTEGTPRSPFCSLYTAMMSGYRAVAKRKGAYAAMPVLAVPLCELFSRHANLKVGVPRRSQAFPGRSKRKADWKSVPQKEGALKPGCVIGYRGRSEEKEKGEG